MRGTVKDIAVPLSEYAVVGENATILDALKALRDAQALVPPERQPHRAILVRDGRGEIVGKVHYFAFLRALAPERKARAARGYMDRAGVDDDLLESSMHMLDFLTGELVDIGERARNVTVGDVCTTTTVSIEEDRPLSHALPMFLSRQTLSLLVTRGGRTVAILRLSDVFDELSREILREEEHHV